MFESQKAYFDTWRGKKITVIGIGVSNTPLIRMLADKGALVTACDRKERAALGDLAGELETLGVTLRLGEDYLDDLSGDIIFKTPGMRFDHPALLAAGKQGSIITSEMEVFFKLCPCAIIGVTGSDGKTTTTTLIAKMLEAAGKTVHLGGNIGKPLLPEIERIGKEDFAVVELSSFQLHTMRRSPHIAVITNLSPNHLDVHKDMAEYIDAKKNIFTHQLISDILVVNADNDVTASFAGQQTGTLRRFSFKKALDDGIYYEDGTVWQHMNGVHKAILHRSDIRLPGDHNVENYMAAIAAVREFVTDEQIVSVAKTFGGVKHRIEFVREVRGVRFYNDSIGSSPTRTLATLRSFPKKVHLLAGGYDKHLPFDEFGRELPNYVKALYLSGATAPLIRAAVTDSALPVYETETYAEATKLAFENAKAGDIVVLSPACASFDKFKNFEERGEYFIRTVEEL